MQVINYINLEDFEDAAEELNAEITVTDHSHSFRIFKGRNCVALHIYNLLKQKQLQEIPTDRFH